MAAVFPHKWLDPLQSLDLHSGFFYPNPPSFTPVPAFAFHYGAPVLIMAPFRNKNNGGRLLGDCIPIVSKGHAVDMLVAPHLNVINLPPAIPAAPNIFWWLCLLGSSSKCMFASSTVLGQDGPLAVAAGGAVGLNLACNDPCDLPTSEVFASGTVFVGFSFADFVAGLMEMAVEAIVSAVMNKIGSAMFKKIGGKFDQQLADRIPDSLKKKLFGQWARNHGSRLRDAKGRFTSLSVRAFDDVFKMGVNKVLSQMVGGDNALGFSLGLTTAGMDPSLGTSLAAKYGLAEVNNYVDEGADWLIGNASEFLEGD